MAADIDLPDEQDQSEVFDEDNTELEQQVYGGRDNGETLEELPEVLDVTQAAGDDDDDEAEIGEEMDDEQIVASARDSEQDDSDLEDDDLARGEEMAFATEGDLTGVNDPDDPDDADGVLGRSRNEVDLEYVGDLNDLEGAASAAQALESDRLSDSDLRELDYKDEFTVDDDEAAPAPAR
jgi:hypothetical protein